MKNLFIIGLFMGCLGCNGFLQSGSSSSALPKVDDGSFNYADTDYKLVVATGPFQGRSVTQNIKNSKLKILVPIGVNKFVPTGAFTSSEWHVSGQITAGANEYKTLEIEIPVQNILQGVNTPLVSQLPNGDSLDFLTSGEAQHFSFPLDTQDLVTIHIYLSPRYLVGVFIQTPFDLASSNRYPVVPMGSLLEMGFISTHPHRPPLNGGAFVFISLPR